MVELAIDAEETRERFAFHWLPKHDSWPSLIEAWFTILKKKYLMQSALAAFAAAERIIGDFVVTSNAHPVKLFMQSAPTSAGTRTRPRLHPVIRATRPLPKQ